MQKLSFILLVSLIALSGCQGTKEREIKHNQSKPSEQSTKHETNSGDTQQVEHDTKSDETRRDGAMSHSGEPVETFEIAHHERNNVLHKAGRYIVQNSDNRLVIVNKQYELIPHYAPKDLTIPQVKFSFPEKAPKRYLRQEAAEALRRLFVLAKKDGMILIAVSGYRPYERQEELYRQEVKMNGAKLAAKYVAKPGHSEHQTGLAIDVSAPSVNNALAPSLGDVKEGKWLAANAHRAGFIIRYELGKEEVTGYNYEPWHIRYIGMEHATRVYQEKLTLEQYLTKYKGIELTK